MKKINLQKIVYSAAFLLGALFFVYSLIFSTDIYPLANMADQASSVTYVPGAEVYSLAQPFNKLLLILSVIMIVVSLAPIIFFSSSRRLFYLSNYVSSLVFMAYSLFMAINTVVHVLYFRSQYLLVDFDRYKEVAELSSERFVQSTFYFDLGLVISLLALGVCAAMAVLLLKKRKLSTAKEANND